MIKAREEELATTEEASTLQVLGIPLERLGDVDAEQLKQLCELKNSLEDREAEKAYNAALTELQKEAPPCIQADCHNQQTNSKHAKYDAVLRVLKPLYTKHGFTILFGEEPCEREGFIMVVATVSHVDGHSKPYRRFAPIDNLGPKGAPTKTLLHGCESSMKYMQRKLVEAICGVSEGEADDDGNAAGTEFVSPEEAGHIRDLLEEVEDLQRREKFLSWAQAAGPETVPASKYGEATRLLSKVIREQGGSQ